MSNARWLINNIVDDAVISSSPVVLSGKPESNLQRMARSLTTRSSSLTTQDIKLSWSSTKTASMVAECYTNFTTGAQRRVILYPNADWTGSPVYDSTAVNCWAYTGLSPHFNPLHEEVRIRKNGAIYFPSVSFKSAIVRYTDPSNPDGYMDFSWLFMGVPFEFFYGFPYSSGAAKPGSLSKKTRMADASNSVSKGENWFDLPLSHDGITDADYPHVLAAADRLGTDRRCFFSQFPGVGDYREMYRQGCFTMREASAFETQYFQMQKGGFMFDGQ